jgi:hypothetical protein
MCHDRLSKEILSSYHFSFRKHILRKKKDVFLNFFKEKVCSFTDRKQGDRLIPSRVRTNRDANCGPTDGPTDQPTDGPTDQHSGL